MGTSLVEEIGDGKDKKQRYITPVTNTLMTDVTRM